MIRVLLGSSLPIAGLGLAALFVAPVLQAGPRGEPIVVAAPEAAMLQPASFDSSDCSAALLEAAVQGALPGVHILAVSVRAGTGGLAVTVDRVAEDTIGDGALIFVFDGAGELLAAGTPSSLDIEPAGAAAFADCAEPQEPVQTGQI